MTIHSVVMVSVDELIHGCELELRVVGGAVSHVQTETTLSNTNDNADAEETHACDRRLPQVRRMHA